MQSFLLGICRGFILLVDRPQRLQRVSEIHVRVFLGTLRGKLGTGTEHLCRQRQRLVILKVFARLDDLVLLHQAIDDFLSIGL
ncbi:MAG: hypothetical protein WBG92_16850 [Thiohalocapsa sp.]